MDLSLEKLEEAVALRRKIELLEKRFGSLLRDTSPPASIQRDGHRVSAATRAKIAAAARARWARTKGQTVSKQAKKKGGLTAAGRRKLSQMMKARWAARRKATAKK
jgi:predicted nucleic acid-binding Zn ribbon protein